MVEVITGRTATYFPHARQLRTPEGDAPWQGAVDIVSTSGLTVYVCPEKHSAPADAFIDAVVEALVMADLE